MLDAPDDVDLRNASRGVCGLIRPSRDREIDDVELAEHARQDGVKDRPVSLPGTGYGDHRALSDAIANNADGTAARQRLENEFRK